MSVEAGRGRSRVMKHIDRYWAIDDLLTQETRVLREKARLNNVEGAARGCVTDAWNVRPRHR